MTRIISTIFSFIAIMTLTGCSSVDEPAVSDMADEETISFSLRIDSRNVNEPATRSLAPGYHFGDGTSINTVKCYVYNQANGSSAEPVKIIDIPISNLNKVSIPLPKQQSFDLVILATSIPQTDPSSKMYYSRTERTLKVNYGSIYGNDEELDCFYAVIKNINTETVLTDAIVLRRPFAQLNVGAKDYSSYNASYPIASVQISVDGIYEKINLMNGSLVGDPVNVTFMAVTPALSQVYPISGATYLTMNYLLVNTRKLSTVKVTINHSNTTPAQNLAFKNIALERNYQTNMTLKTLFPPQYN